MNREDSGSQKERRVDGKAIRMIVIFGVVATLLLTVMMMFSLDKVTDTAMPQIAADVGAEFRPALAEEPPAAVRLTMVREPGPPPRRVYTLRLRPSAKVAGARKSLETLMYHAAEQCALEIGEARSEVRIRCVAELPGGGEKETTYLRDEHGSETGVGVIREVASLPEGAPRAAGAPKR